MVNDEPTGTPVSRADAIKYQKSKIASLKLDLQESDIKISQLEKKANKKLISCKTGWYGYLCGGFRKW